ncbi:hypothetical protein QJQ45_000051 [Haematococcus lacustris]|nr:hypothetical protein QJQ45_000051 [Haematococcus lacustris]
MVQTDMPTFARAVKPTIGRTQAARPGFAPIPLVSSRRAYLPDRRVTLITKGVHVLQLLALHSACGCSSSGSHGLLHGFIFVWCTAGQGVIVRSCRSPLHHRAAMADDVGVIRAEDLFKGIKLQVQYHDPAKPGSTADHRSKSVPGAGGSVRTPLEDVCDSLHESWLRSSWAQAAGFSPSPAAPAQLPPSSPPSLFSPGASPHASPSIVTGRTGGAQPSSVFPELYTAVLRAVLLEWGPEAPATLEERLRGADALAPLFGLEAGQHEQLLCRALACNEQLGKELQVYSLVQKASLQQHQCGLQAADFSSQPSALAAVLPGTHLQAAYTAWRHSALAEVQALQELQQRLPAFRGVLEVTVIQAQGLQAPKTGTTGFMCCVKPTFMELNPYVALYLQRPPAASQASAARTSGQAGAGSPPSQSHHAATQVLPGSGPAPLWRTALPHLQLSDPQLDLHLRVRQASEERGLAPGSRDTVLAAGGIRLQGLQSGVTQVMEVPLFSRKQNSSGKSSGAQAGYDDDGEGEEQAGGRRQLSHSSPAGTSGAPGLADNSVVYDPEGDVVLGAGGRAPAGRLALQLRYLADRRRRPEGAAGTAAGESGSPGEGYLTFLFNQLSGGSSSHPLTSTRTAADFMSRFRAASVRLVVQPQELPPCTSLATFNPHSLAKQLAAHLARAHQAGLLPGRSDSLPTHPLAQLPLPGLKPAASGSAGKVLLQHLQSPDVAPFLPLGHGLGILLRFAQLYRIRSGMGQASVAVGAGMGGVEGTAEDYLAAFKACWEPCLTWYNASTLTQDEVDGLKGCMGLFLARALPTLNCHYAVFARHEGVACFMLLLEMVGWAWTWNPDQETPVTMLRDHIRGAATSRLVKNLRPGSQNLAEVMSFLVEEVQAASQDLMRDMDIQAALPGLVGFALSNSRARYTTLTDQLETAFMYQPGSNAGAMQVLWELESAVLEHHRLLKEAGFAVVAPPPEETADGNSCGVEQERASKGRRYQEAPPPNGRPVKRNGAVEVAGQVARMVAAESWQPLGSSQAYAASALELERISEAPGALDPFARRTPIVMHAHGKAHGHEHRLAKLSSTQGAAYSLALLKARIPQQFDSIVRHTALKSVLDAEPGICMTERMAVLRCSLHKPWEASLLMISCYPYTLLMPLPPLLLLLLLCQVEEDSRELGSRLHSALVTDPYLSPSHIADYDGYAGPLPDGPLARLGSRGADGSAASPAAGAQPYANGHLRAAAHPHHLGGPALGGQGDWRAQGEGPGGQQVSKEPGGPVQGHWEGRQPRGGAEQGQGSLTPGSLLADCVSSEWELLRLVQLQVAAHFRSTYSLQPVPALPPLIPALAHLCLDPHQLRSCLITLLTNAVGQKPEEGTNVKVLGGILTAIHDELRCIQQHLGSQAALAAEAAGCCWRAALSALQLLVLNQAGFRPVREEEADVLRQFLVSLQAMFEDEPRLEFKRIGDPAYPDQLLRGKRMPAHHNAAEANGHSGSPASRTLAASSVGADAAAVRTASTSYASALLQAAMADSADLQDFYSVQLSCLQHARLTPRDAGNVFVELGPQQLPLVDLLRILRQRRKAEASTQAFVTDKLREASAIITQVVFGLVSSERVVSEVRCSLPGPGAVRAGGRLVITQHVACFTTMLDSDLRGTTDTTFTLMRNKVQAVWPGPEPDSLMLSSQDGDCLAFTGFARGDGERVMALLAPRTPAAAAAAAAAGTPAASTPQAAPCSPASHASSLAAAQGLGQQQPWAAQQLVSLAEATGRGGGSAGGKPQVWPPSPTSTISMVNSALASPEAGQPAGMDRQAKRIQQGTRPGLDTPTTSPGDSERGSGGSSSTGGAGSEGRGSQGLGSRGHRKHPPSFDPSSPALPSPTRPPSSQQGGGGTSRQAGGAGGGGEQQQGGGNELLLSRASRDTGVPHSRAPQTAAAPSLHPPGVVFKPHAGQPGHSRSRSQGAGLSLPHLAPSPLAQSWGKGLAAAGTAAEQQSGQQEEGWPDEAPTPTLGQASGPGWAKLAGPSTPLAFANGHTSGSNPHTASRGSRHNSDGLAPIALGADGPVLRQGSSLSAPGVATAPGSAADAAALEMSVRCSLVGTLRDTPGELLLYPNRLDFVGMDGTKRCVALRDVESVRQQQALMGATQLAVRVATPSSNGAVLLFVGIPDALLASLKQRISDLVTQAD